MSLSSLLLKNITDLYTSSGIMKGGKLNSSTPQTVNNGGVFIMFFLGILVILLIKGLIVYIVYNYLVPKIIYSLSLTDKTLEKIESDFRPLTYSESLLLVILFNTLFRV
jgi:hypothetical protein